MTDVADRLYRRLLILRCQAGDRLAFEELITSYGPGLRYFLERMLRESHAAEDLFQQVWLDVFRGIVAERSASISGMALKYVLAMSSGFADP
jgi:RNA polymerase sigma-70 factor (ECF subfamily)